MTLFSIILLAMALAMDALAVSISTGTRQPPYPKRDRLMMALSFGLFQGLMPILGYFVGTLGANLLSQVDHWIAFLLLVIVGGKMVHEGSKPVESCAEDSSLVSSPRLSWRTLLLLSIATSIDAAAVGLTLAMVQAPIFWASAIIAAITFIISWLGVEFGCVLGRKFGSKAEVLGGLVLIGIGSKILFDHMILPS